jgi:biopolymer transport protein TolQ
MMIISVPITTTETAGIAMGGAFSHDIIQMIMHAGPVVKFVLFVLLFFSIVSWAIVFLKLRLLGKARKETEDFLELFWEHKGLKHIYEASEGLTYSPLAKLFKSGYTEFSRIRKVQTPTAPEKRTEKSEGGVLQSQRLIMDNLERSLRKSTVDQINRLEKGVGFLATTGNTAPFVGLFGTVWGIMESFRGIGLKGSASLAVVAPGISEALIATATGLAAAIPAVVAFNYFTNKITTFRAEMDIFASDMLSTVERELVRKQQDSK